mmetsp:Transcript_628/g.1461  ORF Transcript_628/g.1461 Transcript_628/m.1461 type:complete len:215 (-) Transcript_628:30-674(-)
MASKPSMLPWRKTLGVKYSRPPFSAPTGRVSRTNSGPSTRCHRRGSFAKMAFPRESLALAQTPCQRSGSSRRSSFTSRPSPGRVPFRSSAFHTSARLTFPVGRSTRSCTYRSWPSHRSSSYAAVPTAAVAPVSSSTARPMAGWWHVHAGTGATTCVPFSYRPKTHPRPHAEAGATASLDWVRHPTGGGGTTTRKNSPPSPSSVRRCFRTEPPSK